LKMIADHIQNRDWGAVAGDGGMRYALPPYGGVAVPPDIGGAAICQPLAGSYTPALIHKRMCA